MIETEEKVRIFDLEFVYFRNKTQNRKFVNKATEEEMELEDCQELVQEKLEAVANGNIQSSNFERCKIKFHRILFAPKFWEQTELATMQSKKTNNENDLGTLEILNVDDRKVVLADKSKNIVCTVSEDFIYEMDNLWNSLYTKDVRKIFDPGIMNLSLIHI